MWAAAARCHRVGQCRYCVQGLYLWGELRRPVPGSTSSFPKPSEIAWLTWAWRVGSSWQSVAVLTSACSISSDLPKALGRAPLLSNATATTSRAGSTPSETPHEARRCPQSRVEPPAGEHWAHGLFHRL